MKFLKTKKTLIFLLALIFLGGLFRFWNLNWDQGHFFNPDEGNNIIHPAANLKFPYKPDQFTYGSLTIYLYRLGGEMIAFLTKNPAWAGAAHLSLIGRFISASLSLVLIPLNFLLAKKLFSEKTGLIAAALTSFNVGLIQASHFATTEIILTVAGFALAWTGVLLLEEKKNKLGYFAGGLILGFASAAKISALVFLPPFLLAHFLSLKRKEFFRKNLWLFFSCFLAFLVFFLVFPYSLLDFPSFIGSFRFQKDIATGQIITFFSEQFKETVPYLFQLDKIFPWILGWPVFLSGLLGFFLIAYQGVKTGREQKEVVKKKIVLLFLPGFYFLYNGSLFVKWTRYMIPLMPFFCLFGAVFLTEIYLKVKKSRKILVSSLIFLVLVFQLLYARAFFQIYLQPDSRIRASAWIYQNLSRGSILLLEPLDVVALPLPLKAGHPSQYQQDWFDFYGLDHQDWPEKVEDLANHLAATDYLIIGTRRLYAHRFRLKHLFPLGERYYRLLFEGRLGFDKIKEISSYPKIFNLEINDDQAEETFQVFDHPKVMIFQNSQHLPANQLKQLLSYD